MCGLLCNARIKNGWLRLPSLSRSSSTAAVACVFVYLEPKKRNKRAKGSPTATAEMRLASVIDRALRKVGSNVHKETFLALFFMPTRLLWQPGSICLDSNFPPCQYLG